MFFTLWAGTSVELCLFCRSPLTSKMNSLQAQAFVTSTLCMMNIHTRIKFQYFLKAAHLSFASVSIKCNKLSIHLMLQKLNFGNLKRIHRRGEHRRKQIILVPFTCASKLRLQHCKCTLLNSSTMSYLTCVSVSQRCAVTDHLRIHTTANKSRNTTKAEVSYTFYRREDNSVSTTTRLS